jgi:hypothetical protein
MEQQLSKHILKSRIALIFLCGTPEISIYLLQKNEVAPGGPPLICNKTSEDTISLALRLLAWLILFDSVLVLWLGPGWCKNNTLNSCSTCATNK